MYMCFSIRCLLYIIQVPVRAAQGQHYAAGVPLVCRAGRPGKHFACNFVSPVTCCAMFLQFKYALSLFLVGCDISQIAKSGYLS